LVLLAAPKDDFGCVHVVMTLNCHDILQLEKAQRDMALFVCLFLSFFHIHRKYNEMSLKVGTGYEYGLRK
jgi:hypothetical protein